MAKKEAMACLKIRREAIKKMGDHMRRDPARFWGTRDKLIFERLNSR